FFYSFFFFFFSVPATTEIYTLSLHDALPISELQHRPDRPVADRRQPGRQQYCRVEDRPANRGTVADRRPGRRRRAGVHEVSAGTDRKSTRLNSSHLVISYAVFCLKKKKKKKK